MRRDASDRLYRFQYGDPRRGSRVHADAAFHADPFAFDLQCVKVDGTNSGVNGDVPVTANFNGGGCIN